MGFFTAVTGQDDRDKEYSYIIDYCLWKIRDKADYMGVNLNDYYNVSNVNSFQEASIFLFLAAAAVENQNEKKNKNILEMIVRDKEALNNILNKHLRNNGIRGMDLRTGWLHAKGGASGQVHFGIDFIRADKHDTANDPDVVMTAFIQSLVDGIAYEIGPGSTRRRY